MRLNSLFIFQVPFKIPLVKYKTTKNAIFQFTFVFKDGCASATPYNCLGIVYLLFCIFLTLNFVYIIKQSFNCKTNSGEPICYWLIWFYLTLKWVTICTLLICLGHVRQLPPVIGYLLVIKIFYTNCLFTSNQAVTFSRDAGTLSLGNLK